MLQLHFDAFLELKPGPKWLELFQLHWPAYQQWFLSKGDENRPSYLECRRMLRLHLPEIVPTYEELVALAGGTDLAARFLSLYRPPPYISGCSQAVWSDQQESVLVRNYDYSPRLCEGTLSLTQWNDKRVIAMGDCLWGVLDGINDSGLSVSLSFGGRKVVGTGFGVPLILRYILEFCSTTSEAIEVLSRVPTHMSYNVTLLDNTGKFQTIFMAPDRSPVIRQIPIATNHQGKIEWARHALATSSLEREQFLSSRLADTEETEKGFIKSFLNPPLYSTEYDRGYGTVYTSVYRPATGEMELRWPGTVWRQSFDNFEEGRRIIRFPSNIPVLT
jgi:predicted choloylglycine hydrolase